jgi:serine phosphatase RsbU (regulator of sigma subunit)
MIKYVRIVKGLALFLGLIFFYDSYGQTGFNNGTRAVFIFDIAKYIDYGKGFADSSIFRIGILDRDEFLFFEMGNLRTTRTRIQDKPVELVKFNSESKITHTQILYVSKSSGFNLEKVRSAIGNRQTLLLTEGYEFRESMINFMGVEGEVPIYSVNEDLINRAGMAVNSNMLRQAIKTKEDWENLFGVASEQILIQQDTIRQQFEMISSQREEITRQKSLLDSLDREITAKVNILNEKQKVLDTQYSLIKAQQGEISVQRETIAAQQNEVQIQKDTLSQQRAKIALQLERIDEQLERISVQDDRIKVQLESIEKQRMGLYFAMFALFLVSVLGYYIYRSYKIKREANIRLEEKNKTILLQKEEIENQRDLAAAQRDQIGYQKRHIEDSIMYAKRIQTALIPSLELFSDKLEHFVLYKPLSIVSGDFYWVSSGSNPQVIISADCTGHGVPGAFMSMLGVTLLNEIVNGKNILMPDKIIENLRQGIIRSLRQVAGEDSVKDGLDIAVCVVDFDKNILWYAGANNPLYLVRNGELLHYRADRMPVAIHYKMEPYTLHRIELQKGDAFYIFSDGFADQFGGPRQRKYMSMQLRGNLVEMSGMPMLKQGEQLNRLFEEWRGDSPQIDDVTIIGVRY